MNEIKSLIFSLLMVFALGLFFFPFFIRWQEKTRIGQKIKREGPNLHLHKENTPSMGGIIMILSGLLVLSFFQQFTPQIWIILITLLSFAGLGLLDDYFKSFRGEPWSLKARHKFLLELVFSVFILILGFPLFPHYLIVPYGSGIIELGEDTFFSLWFVFNFGLY
jgi:phospho-N-acetylmuramoyl-pentapeptide-transferase